MRRLTWLISLLLVLPQSSVSAEDHHQATTSLRGTTSHDELQQDNLPFKFHFGETFFRQTTRKNRKLQENRSTMVDLNFRFNKFTVFPDHDASFLPLTASDYPLKGDVANTLKNFSNAVSIICDGDPALPPNHTAKILEYIDAIGGLPTMPRYDPSKGHLEFHDDEFWDEFRQVAQLQYGRRLEIEPATILRAPDLWKERNHINAVAEAVHDEYPGSLQVELITWLWSQGVKVDHDIVPFRSQSDFVGLQVAMADLNTWAIGAVAPMNFYSKWYAGRPRPEEVAYAIATRELSYDDGVPPDVVQLVDLMKLDSANDFTAYPEGAPRHPSWPAMHSAASSASFWLAVILELTPEQYCEALRVDYAVAFARTCAGVHYPTDNIAGLNLGQAIVADLLPDHLAKLYGSDPVKVQAKIDKLRFDWGDFDSYSCSGAPNLVTRP